MKGIKSIKIIKTLHKRLSLGQKNKKRKTSKRQTSEQNKKDKEEENHFLFF